MRRLGLPAITLLSLMALLVAACGGDGDGDGQDTGATPTTAADGSGDGDGDGVGDPSTGLEGTGVFQLTFQGETSDFDVTCAYKTGEFWSYSIVNPAGTDYTVTGLGFVADGEDQGSSLSVVAGELSLGSGDFTNVTSGGNTWAATALDPNNGEFEFEVSCSG